MAPILCEACNAVLDTSRQYLLMRGSVCANCDEPFLIAGQRIKSLAETATELAVDGYSTLKVPKGLLP